MFIEESENEPTRDTIKYLAHPDGMNTKVIDTFVRHIGMIERSTENMKETYETEESEQEKRKRYEQYAENFCNELVGFLPLLENEPEYRALIMEAETKLQKVKEYEQRVKKYLEENNKSIDNEVEALHKMYQDYGAKTPEDLEKEIDHLKSLLDEKIDENSSLREVNDFLKDEKAEVKEVIESQPVIEKGYVCDKWHYPKTPASF